MSKQGMLVAISGIANNPTTDNYQSALDQTDAIWDNLDTTTIYRIHLKKSSATEEINDPEIAIEWDAEEYKDSEGYTHSNSSNPEQITVLEDGVYHITGNVVYDNTGAGRVSCWAYIKVNDTIVNTSRGAYYSRGTALGNYGTMQINTKLSLSENDVVEIWANSYDADQTDAVNTVIAYSELIITRNGVEATTNTWRPLAVPSWTAPSLLNSWVDYGSPHEVAGYWKDPNTGIVYIRGTIKSGTTTNGTNIFQLPSGYRPSADLIIATTDGGYNSCIFVFRSDGDVEIHNIGNNSWLALNNISFHV